MTGSNAIDRVGVESPPARLALLLAGPVAIALSAWIYLELMIGDMAIIPGMPAMMMSPQS